MKDAAGKELQIGDTVGFISGVRNSQIQFGKITGFKSTPSIYQPNVIVEEAIIKPDQGNRIRYKPSKYLVRIYRSTLTITGITILKLTDDS